MKLEVWNESNKSVSLKQSKNKRENRHTNNSIYVHLMVNNRFKELLKCSEVILEAILTFSSESSKTVFISSPTNQRFPFITMSTGGLWVAPESALQTYRINFAKLKLRSNLFYALQQNVFISLGSSSLLQKKEGQLLV